MNITAVAAETQSEDPIIPTNEIATIYSDWHGTVFGDVGGQDKITKDNFEITESEENTDTVVLRSSGNRGKISSSSDGIAYYFKQVPTDANFEITATATVEHFDANNQVSFGVMLRDDVHAYLHGIEYGVGDYVAVGALDQNMKSFTRLDGALTKVDFDNVITPPSSGAVYELSVRKSGNLVTVKIGDEVKVIEDFTGDINYAGLFTARNAKVEYSNVNLAIEGEVELGDWEFSVFGSNTSDNSNPDPVINEDGSVTLTAAGGKISSSVDGLSFYHKELPSNTNFEITTKATVHKFGANNQVSFGLMIRDEIGAHRNSSGHESNYVAVGGLDQSVKGFYKHGTQTKLNPFDSNIPTTGSEYDLTIKKSGDTYVVSVNGEDSEPQVLESLFSDEIFAGVFVARDAEVTFSDAEIKVDNRKVESLVVDPTNMKTDYLIGETLDLNGLVVIAEFSDGSTEVVSDKDYIVTGFDSSVVGPNRIAINYNGVSAAIDLEIHALTVTDLTIKYYPAKIDYYKGDLFDPQGLIVVATYNDGYKTAELSDGQYSFSFEEGYVFEEAGDFPITITSTETPDQTIDFNVNVKDADITALEIRDLPTKTLYFIGDELNLAGLAVYGKYSDGKEVRLTRDELRVSGFDSETAGTKTVLIFHKGKEVSFPVTVKVKEVEGIEVTNYPKTTYYIGDEFESSGLVVSKVYDNSDREILPEAEYTIDTANFDNQTAGTYSINIIPADSGLASIDYKVTVREKVEPEWKQIRFGQSSSTANNYIEVLEDGAIKLVALEGGGKITGDHDGITFYYTELDAEKENFVLSADIKVQAFAKTPYDGQESFGIMARDVNGPANDSSVFASNIAAIGGFSGGTREPMGTQLFARTGVVASDGEGSQGIQKIMLDPTRPDANNTAENYRLTLEKTNSGFTGKINDGQEEIIHEPEILTTQDGKMYVGFYTARLATIEVRNIDLTVTAAATDSPKVSPPARAVTPELEVMSLDKVSKTEYSLLVKSNVNGTVTVKKGQDIIVEDAVVEAGKVVDLPTIINDNADTNFSIAFLPDDTQYLTNYNKIVRNFTVTMKTYAEDGNIYVSPVGTSAGHGTKESPLDLDTAIEFVMEGQKIIVLEGHYVRSSPLEIKKFNDGTKEAMKYLIADPDATERPLIDFDKKSEGVVHSGNYWHVEGIDFARSAGNTKGYTIGGSHNTIENIRTFENGDTGLQISRTDAYEEDKSKWPSYNLILNSISFDNSDPAENNADGFAAKLTSGDGNVFRGTVAYNNIDDGWDLYTKVGTGAIGAVLIENSIAFNNGTLSNGHVGSGDKNGFKLGGEGVHVPHVIKNSLAFGNGTYGYTSNSNPGVIAENNISAENGTNLGFSTYGGIATDFTINGFISIKTSGTSKDSYPSALGSDRNYLFNGTRTVNKSGEELSAEHSADILGSFENLFTFDHKGRILSVKENQWAIIWATFDEVVGPEDPPLIDITELEELIAEATVISNDKKKYTKSSFAALQEAIEAAEATLETIATEEELSAAIVALAEAIEGLKKAPGKGNGKGNGNSNGNGNNNGNGNGNR